MFVFTNKIAGIMGPGFCFIFNCCCVARQSVLNLPGKALRIVYLHKRNLPLRKQCAWNCIAAWFFAHVLIGFHGNFPSTRRTLDKAFLY